ncbi:MAG: GAF domain-containing protein [Chloroflexota bacterium]
MSRLSIGEAIQQVVSVLSEVEDTSLVLQAVASAARQMMQADEAYLLLREGGRLLLRAADGLPSDLVGHSFVRTGEGIEGWVADHGEPVALADATKERRFRDLPGRESRVRALAVVPMKLRDDVVGVLAAAGMNPSPPPGSRLTALEILASIAAVTIENDRLLRQERRRARQAERLLELAAIQDRELQPFLHRVADTINSALGVDDTELVLLSQDGHQVLCEGQAAGADGAAPRDESILLDPLGSGWAAELLATGRPLLCDDVTLDPRIAPEFGPTAVRSLLAVPIQVGGERRGILRVATTHTGSFRPEDLAFVTMMAAQVGLSVERAELARRQVEMSREQARQQARQEFLGLVSHELKTPVAVLKAYTELLLRKTEIDPSRASDQDVLSRMLEQADRMLAMIEQLLDLQKIEAGQLPLEVSRFDLVHLARRVAENLQLTAPRHRMVLQTEGRLLVLADRRRIEEVLFNLLENAVKYSPDGSSVTVTIAGRASSGEGEEEAWVSIADQGIGIPAQDLPHIFDRFFQGQGRLHRGHVGLGLGLHIAREIIDRHGGKMWTESTEGKGSVFQFTLPLAPGDDER